MTSENEMTVADDGIDRGSRKKRKKGPNKNEIAKGIG